MMPRISQCAYCGSPPTLGIGPQPQHLEEVEYLRARVAELERNKVLLYEEIGKAASALRKVRDEADECVSYLTRDSRQ